MKLTVKPISADIVLYASYKTPMIGLIEQSEKRIGIVNNFLRLFSLRLDDIKFNQNTLSGNFMHFAKYYGSALFNVSFGLEETSSRIFRAQSTEQALDLYGKLFQILDEIPMSSLRISIGLQVSAERNPELYLESLSPNAPSGFQDLLSGRGVQYNLKIPNHNLNIYISLASSLYHENAIYLSIDNQFSPHVYDFQTSSKIIMDYYDFTLKELGIHVQKEE